MLRPTNRRSRAALKRIERNESWRTILIALAANIVIAIAKLITGLMSGSTALLAEAAHSLADASNEVLLGISLRRATAPADELHPLGHGRERFLWAFLAAIASFLIGGCFSVGMAIRQLAHGEPLGNPTAAWIVLGVAFLGDGISLVQSLRQARSEAAERGWNVWFHLFRSSDPTVRAVVVEDSAALIGLVIAAAGLLLSHHLGNDRPDAFASLLIGLLMAATAFALGRPLADFLVGKSLPPKLLDEIRAVIDRDDAVEEILSVQAVYIGPEEVIVSAKVRPSPQLTVEQLGRAMDNLDQALRETSPFVADVFIDVTAHHASEFSRDGIS
ncbi:MAG: cation diffusion facilitator family transporter [Acidobacteria bacterium]|nr:cation diffusion facilitator family transporter [Acidobacteriota bacterium]MBV9070108.1 cation diffusion facilitator family transporter [Acidobacteriota bacterium]MBV9185473.1 cation diffusion facilitator family transporter [Acidobacteriota bacterium]